MKYVLSGTMDRHRDIVPVKPAELVDEPLKRAFGNFTDRYLDGSLKFIAPMSRCVRCLNVSLNTSLEIYRWLARLFTNTGYKLRSEIFLVYFQPVASKYLKNETTGAVFRSIANGISVEKCFNGYKN